jgi:hypothetical protein
LGPEPAAVPVVSIGHFADHPATFVASRRLASAGRGEAADFERNASVAR